MRQGPATGRSGNHSVAAHGGGSASGNDGAELSRICDSNHRVLLFASWNSGIIYAAQVNSKLQAGDLAGAQIASKNAKMWCLIALGVGLACTAMWVMLTMLGVLGSLSRH